MVKSLTVQKLSSGPQNRVLLGQFSLTAAERTRTRHRFFWAEQNCEVVLQLPRGTVLQHGNWLTTTDNKAIEVVAKPEPVLTVTASEPLQLLQAAYHLGNRHVPLEIKTGYLRLGADPVLETMLKQLGVIVRAEMVSFHPELGAYHHTH
ncbi:MAG: urease accessory protein UreE [Spirulina sp. SIO3F2]|nr:urease accessory protein UreE [Spirulina sp. SIO3F2]